MDSGALGWPTGPAATPPALCSHSLEWVRIAVPWGGPLNPRLLLPAALCSPFPGVGMDGGALGWPPEPPATTPRCVVLPFPGVGMDSGALGLKPRPLLPAALCSHSLEWVWIAVHWG